MAHGDMLYGETQSEQLPHRRVNVSHSVESTASAVLLDKVKAAHWGRFQRVCGHALERLGSPNMASASLLDMHLDSNLGCVHIAHSCFSELPFVCNSYTFSR